MLYIMTLVIFFIWSFILIKKRHTSWHSILLTYSISVFSADMLEVTFNLLLGLYKFPTGLLANPVYDNELGIVFSDTLILPFVFMVFIHYAKKDLPWRSSLPFAVGLIILEWVFLRFGYLKYLHWSIIYSFIVYIAAFRFWVYLAHRILTYNPPIPYFARLLTFSHMIIMWVGAVFALPLLKMYQFRPGVFMDIMADCRFTDLLSGDILSILVAFLIPRINTRLKPLVFTIIACFGAAFALFAYFKGWLIYYKWNHFFTVFRYFIPLFLIMLYDRFESS